ncbi:hypothetical protein ELI_10135 [Erythrobacter litoralis HTCC2594]|uniref:DUF4402 domain-containing protein n=2 Tax=Erythrobacter litoralis TaxID=39960 RepID=Q2N872_ERYLH|nr:hypothetical protein ELI_10135 [Erythrobacter litoralis HTCC2594]
MIAAGLAIAVAPTPASADPSTLRILPVSELRFGSFAVPSTGSVTVGPTGSVTRSGVFSITSGDTSPARFILRYDRGNNSRRTLDLRIQLTIAAPGSVVLGGITARLSNLQTDLPGYAVVQPNQIIEVQIPNCRTRVCETSFNLGGQLDIRRDYGGALVAIPIPVDAVLVSVR